VLVPQATTLAAVASSNANQGIVIDEVFMRVSFTARNWSTRGGHGSAGERGLKKRASE
jgi:hypothetical protein